MRALVLILSLAVGPVMNDGIAQAAKVEREVVSRAQQLRLELLRAWRTADASERTSAARRCAELDRARHLGGLDAAIRLARGESVTADTAFRGDLLPFVAPEVLDPSVYPRVFVTVRSTRRDEPSGELAFVCRLLALDDSERLAEATVVSADPVRDLSGYDLRAELRVDELADGPYVVEIETRIDGEAVTGGAPFRLPIRVARGYAASVDALPLYYSPFHPESQERGASVAARLRVVAGELTTAEAQAAWVGALLRVDRAFRGMARIADVDGLADLHRFERVRSNLANGRDPWAGLPGRTTIALPLGQEVVRDDAEALMRLPHVTASVDLSRGEEPRPLVVFLPGTPTWNGGTDRPLVPKFLAPEWLVERLQVAGFDAKGEFHTVVLESVGRMRSPTRTLADVTRWLIERLPVDRERVVWVGEREGAFCVSRALLAEPELVSHGVLVLGGSFSGVELERLDRPVLLVGAQGHASTEVLLGVAAKAASVGAPARMLEGFEQRPWPIAISAAADALEEFVRVKPVRPARSTAR